MFNSDMSYIAHKQRGNWVNKTLATGQRLHAFEVIKMYSASHMWGTNNIKKTMNDIFVQNAKLT